MTLEAVEMAQVLVGYQPISPYVVFLATANRAFREADQSQRQQIRAYSSQHLSPAEYTSKIREVMGW